MIAYSIIMFAVAVVFLTVGSLVYRGKTNIIHDYHQTKIREEDKRKYGKAFAKAMFCFSLILIVSGIIALFGDENFIVFISIAVLFIGLIVLFVLISKVQKKYNQGMF